MCSPTIWSNQTFNPPTLKLNHLSAAANLLSVTANHLRAAAIHLSVMFDHLCAVVCRHIALWVLVRKCIHRNLDSKQYFIHLSSQPRGKSINLQHN